MILSIAFKEFYNNLVSARFVIGFLLCLVLIPLSLVVNLEDYQGKRKAYETQFKQAEEALKVTVYSDLRPRIVKPPEPLSIFSRGISYNLGSTVNIQLGAKPFEPGGKAAASDNPLMNAYFSVDFCSFLALVLSLLALLFTYDACSGEREDGTLKQVFSNSLARSSMLLGKVLGAGLTLLPILLFCYLTSILILLLSPEIAFTFSEWVRVGLLLLVSVFFFSLFVFLGLFISSRCRSSAASIIVCLFAWVFFLFIVPNIAGYLAGSFIETPSEKGLRFATGKISAAYWDELQKKSADLPQPDWWMHWNYNVGGDGSQRLIGATKSLYERYRLQNIFSQPMLIDYADKKWALEKAYLDELDRQRLLAERLSLVSPSQIFRLLCSSLCRTNVESYQRFMESTGRYREEFIQYFRDKDIFASYAYFTPAPPERFMTADEVIRYMTDGEVQSFAELQEWSKAYPYKNITALVKKEIHDWQPENYGPLDISDMPRYNWNQDNVAQSLKDSLVKIAVLLCTGALLFYLSFVSFMRYDVR